MYFFFASSFACHLISLSTLRFAILSHNVIVFVCFISHRVICEYMPLAVAIIQLLNRPDRPRDSGKSKYRKNEAKTLFAMWTKWHKYTQAHTQNHYNLLKLSLPFRLTFCSFFGVCGLLSVLLIWLKRTFWLNIFFNTNFSWETKMYTYNILYVI